MPDHGSTLPSADRLPIISRVRRSVATLSDNGTLAPHGSTIGIACSGGPDSTALVDVLVRLGPPRGWHLHVLHVDHQLRPNSADDGAHVQQVSAALGVQCTVLQVTVDDNGSLQAAARDARYEAMRAYMDDHGIAYLALGHTADDLAETVLMRALTSGTPRSLAPMEYRRGYKLRPLLNIWREETAAYCAARHLTYLVDPSNVNRRFTRNVVRHDLLPVLEQTFPAARRRLWALGMHPIIQGLVDQTDDASGDATEVW